MATKKLTEKAEAVKYLRKLLRPGDAVYCVLCHVSASGMTRRIDFYAIKNNRPVFLTGYVGKALGYTRSKDGGLVVQGCGMDMGFHVVHSLGYALWGAAQNGETRWAKAVRRRLAKAAGSYLRQGGAELPDPELPGGHWFGAAGYALNHAWL